MSLYCEFAIAAQHRYNILILAVDWDTDEPADLSPSEACVSLAEAGKWAAADCAALLKPICKAPYAIPRLGE